MAAEMDPQACIDAVMQSAKGASDIHTDSAKPIVTLADKRLYQVL